MNEADQPVDVELTHEERHMLASGLTDWGGPVLPTPAQAREMGFANRDDLYNTGERIAAAIGAGEPLSVQDWTRALKATELAYAEEGDMWTTIQGFTRAHWSNVPDALRSKVPILPAVSRLRFGP